MIVRLLLFLVINFGALALGGLSTSSGVSSIWYTELNQAPWTPPGWVFGFAWSTIMICFSIYMASLWTQAENKKMLVLLFTLQFLLNVTWNPLFFSLHLVGVALVIISVLTILIGFILAYYRRELKWKSVLLLPYLFWLIIATSLNGYIFLEN